jgi:hypothetical protein
VKASVYEDVRDKKDDKVAGGSGRLAVTETLLTGCLECRYHGEVGRRKVTERCLEQNRKPKDNDGCETRSLILGYSIVDTLFLSADRLQVLHSSD